MHQDPLDTCPYDPVHRIFRSRMPFHLLRCSQNFPCSKKKQCPFDARHLVNQLEFNYHISTCPARENVWHFKLQNDIQSKQQTILPIETQAVVSTDENWDDDPEVRSYNPEKNLQNRAIMRSSIGLSKAKRRQFRMEERRRIQELDANNERQEKVAAQVQKADDDNEYKPLRRPKKLLSDTLNSSALSLNSSIASGAGEKSSPQKKTIPENQVKANTSTTELNVINEQEQICVQIQKTNNNDNQDYKQLRRPKTLPTDSLNTSTLSLNTSKSSIANEKPMMQKKLLPANASASSISSKCVSKPDTPAPNAAPFSYAAALSRNVSKNSDDFDVIVEEEQYDNEKENITNSSFFSFNGNDSIIEKLSKTVEGLAMDDEGHKKKTELLNKEIEKLKNLKQNNESSPDKKLSKCAANFPKLK